MKKKLEAELISIAHRILKLKNRAELDQLQQETLKLYEKLSVLKFVEDNFSEVKPTIGYASAEGKLQEVYGIEKQPEVKANEIEADEEKAHAEKKTEDAPKQDKENAGGEGVDTDSDGKAPIAEEEKEATPEADATEETKGEETQPAAEVSPEEESEVAKTGEPEAAPEKTDELEVEEENTELPAKEEALTAETEQEEAPEAEADTEEETPKQDKENTGGEGVDTDDDGKAPIAAEEKAAQEVEQKEEQAEPAKEVQPAKIIVDAEVGLHPEEGVAITPEPEMPAIGSLPETQGEDNDNDLGEGIDLPSGKPAVSEEEKEYTKGTDAGQTGFDFNFEKKLEDDFKPKQVSLEDFQNYKEPEFIKKDGPAKNADTATPATDDWRNWEPSKSTAAPEAPKPEEPKADPTSLPLRDWRDWEPKGSTAETPKQPEAAKPAEPVRDWRDWEPSKPAAPATPEPPKPVAPAPAASPAAPRPNDGFVRALNLGLNDRIAFEKNLFSGSSEDLNRVVSQLNTLNSFDEAKDFITDLVKPDYNNWAGKEEYEERFMQLVEKKFS